MDFDVAARRLRADQQSSLARNRASRNALRGASAKARREAAAARRHAEERLRARRADAERRARVADGVVGLVRRVERELGVTSVVTQVAPPATSDKNASSSAKQRQGGSPRGQPLFSNSPLASGWTLRPSSIHGEGDKISLPPSILEAMTSQSVGGLDPWDNARRAGGRPIAFRVGVPNPEYAGFPSSMKMRGLVERVTREVIAASDEGELLPSSNRSSPTAAGGGMDGGGDDDDASVASADADDGDDDELRIAVEAYRDELSHRYLSYTHGTVVEFTADDGSVGLPEPIATALVRPNEHSLASHGGDVPATRTVDPASASSTPPAVGEGEGNDERIEKTGEGGGMDVCVDAAAGERTPGHPAYGLFDVPAPRVEVVPMSNLPPGVECTFTPTRASVDRGFYGLKDVKAVLEQSLVRTRATLSMGDVVRTWRRGVSYDLVVSSLSPEEYGAVSCINTTLNVEFGSPEDGGAEGADAEPAPAVREDDAAAPPNDATNNSHGGGRLLSEPPSKTNATECAQSPPIEPATGTKAAELPPEPAADAREGVVSVQIRGRTSSGNGRAGRRRFDVTTATVSDLFAFASQICEGIDPRSFRLVTRFPRRVLRLSASGGSDEDGGCFAEDATLEGAEIAQGQEMFMVEMI